MKITMTRSALVKALQKSLAAAREYDKRAKYKYAKSAAGGLARFRRKIAEALKWDAAKASKEYWSVELPHSERPGCPPKSQASSIKAVLDSVNLDTRTHNFGFTSDSDIGKAVMWEPPDEDE